MGFGAMGGATPDNVTIDKDLSGQLRIKPNLAYPAGDGSGISKLGVYDNTGTNVLLAHDGQSQTNSTSYVKAKTITLTGLNFKSGQTQLQIQFQLYVIGASETGYAKIYRNGSPVGTERSITYGGGWATFTENLTFVNGDTIELWHHATLGGANYSQVQNFRVLGSYNIPQAQAISGNNS